MAVMKAIDILLPILLVLVQIIIIISPSAYATRHRPRNTSPFDFIKHLQGCHRGNTTKGLAQLKNYLHHFGYLGKSPHASDDVFDGDLESAIRIYQENYHIKATGTLDAATVETMVSPRCGDPDIIKGVNTMQRRNINATSHAHHVAHFSFFRDRNRWHKTSLTYGFLPNTRPDAVSAVANAFQRWATATHFSFSRANAGHKPDMVIGFYQGNHGDGHPFDGPGGTIAHAFAPPDGRFHYDAAETWSSQPNPRAIHLESVALHEIGHLLGLGHSNVREATMFPTITRGHRVSLHHDDIQGIKVLYGV